MTLGAPVGQSAIGCSDGSNKYTMTDPLALWKHFPVLYHFDNSVPKTLQYGIIVAFNQYNTITEYEFYKQTLDPSLAKINVTMGNIDGTGNTIAWAHYNSTVNIHEIANAVIKFDSSEKWDILTHGQCVKHGDVQDIISTAVHEIGHLSGLSHSDGDKQTMFYKNAPGQTLRRTLGNGDIEGFKMAYRPSGASSYLSQQK